MKTNFINWTEHYSFIGNFFQIILTATYRFRARSGPLLEAVPVNVIGVFLHLKVFSSDQFRGLDGEVYKIGFNQGDQMIT
jgi:hypothetical protein